MTRQAYHRVHTSSTYLAARTEMFAERGTVCVHCGHEGAGEADFRIPLSVDPDQHVDADALQPSHGANYPCPTCGRECNAERGNKVNFSVFKPALTW